MLIKKTPTKTRWSNVSLLKTHFSLSTSFYSIPTGDKSDIDGIETPSTSLIKELPDTLIETRTPLASRRRLLSSRISEINKEFLIDNDDANDT